MSETITYTKSKYVQDEHTITVDNKRNCFFEGEHAGRREYLGIYPSGGRQKVVLIGGDKTIKLLADFTAGDGLTLYIKAFFEMRENCRQITSEHFFYELRKHVDYLGVGGYQPPGMEDTNENE